MYWDDNHKNVIHHEYMGDITTQDYFEAIHQHESMLSQVDHTVHIIVHGNTQSHPKSFATIMQFADKHIPLNQGNTYIVNKNYFVETMFNIGKKTATNLTARIQYTDSIEEALARIKILS